MNNLFKDPTKRNALLAAAVWVVVLGGLGIGRALFKKTIPWWGKGLIIVFLVATFVLFYIQELEKGRNYQHFADYVAKYDLSPERLAEITGFSKYDFQEDTKGRLSFIYMMNKQKRGQLFEKLAVYETTQKALR